MERMDSKYHVGDSVRIINVDKCAFGYNENMERLIGETRRIRSVQWRGDNFCYCYYIDNDRHGPWMWDDSCFEFASPQELPEFDVSGSDILSLFS